MKAIRLVFLVIGALFLSSCDETSIIESDFSDEDIIQSEADGINPNESSKSDSPTETKKIEDDDKKDTTPPTLFLLGQTEIKINVGSEFNDPGVDYFDESGEVKVEIFGSVDVSIPGKYEILYKATDKFGNSNTIKRLVEVIDTIPPILNGIPSEPVLVEWKTNYDLELDFIAQKISCSDNDKCEILSTGFINTEVKGFYDIVIRAVDRVGLFAEGTVRFSVVDRTPPIVELRGASEVDIKFGSSWSDPGVFVHESEEEYTVLTNLTSTHIFSTLGKVVKTYRVRDNSGNETTISRTFNVYDDVPPLVTLKGESEIIVEAGTLFRDPGITYFENTGVIPIINTNHDYPDTLFNSRLIRTGTYKITYSAVDQSGNQSETLSRTIKVVDTTAPVLRFFGTNNPTQVVEYYIDKPFYGDFYDINFGINYSDNSEGELSISIEDGGFDKGQLGTYSFKYTVTDRSGNSSQIIRRVTVTWSNDFNPYKKGNYYFSFTSFSQRIIPDKFYINSVNLIFGDEPSLFSVARYDWRSTGDKLIFINISPTGVEHEFATYSSSSNLASNVRDRTFKLDTQYSYGIMSKNSNGIIEFNRVNSIGEQNVLFELRDNVNYVSKLNGEKLIRLNGGLEHSLIIDEVSLNQYMIGDQIVIYSQLPYSIVASANNILEGNISSDLNILTRIGENRWTLNNPLS
jgi:hypothetical protein